MSVADLLAKLKLSSNDAEVIFDRDEPVGRPTDLVMPRRRWFRRNKQNDDQVRRAMLAQSDSKTTS